MRQMKNEIIWDRGIAAMNWNNYIPYDDPSIAGLIVESESPEDLFLEKERATMIRDAYRALSDEAKQVIDIVLNSPHEMAKALLTENGKRAGGKTCRNRIVDALWRQWRDRKYARQVVREIENLVALF